MKNPCLNCTQRTKELVLQRSKGETICRRVCPFFKMLLNHNRKIATAKKRYYQKKPSTVALRAVSLTRQRQMFSKGGDE